MVVEARRLSDEISSRSTSASELTPAAGAGSRSSSSAVCNLLDMYGYDDAARYVYGTTYADWKKRHHQKATDEQMEKYMASQSLWAQHDKDLLAVRRPTTATTTSTNTTTTMTGTTKTGSDGPSTALQSNVCCQDVEQPTVLPTAQSGSGGGSGVGSGSNNNNKFRIVGPYRPPPIPDSLGAVGVVRIGILTVSDRAYRNEYATGDMSGPAVQKAVAEYSTTVNVRTTINVVPDDSGAIQERLRAWSDGDDDNRMDIILTTGGTGMSKRDVTPEATRDVLDFECSGLMSFVTTECSRHQPLSSLSRGTAGIRRNTIIANLPGNPNAVDEIIPVLYPLLLNALSDLIAEG